MSQTVPEQLSDLEEPQELSGDESDESELTNDEMFHLLQTERRRAVLRYLQGCDEPVRMRDVAEQVAAWEHDTTVAGLTSTERQRVYIALYQSHLPKLDKAGVIDYQQSRGIVERRPAADCLDPYVDISVPEADVEESTVQRDYPEDAYLFAAAVGSVLLTGSVLELPILATFSGISISVVVLTIIAAIIARRHVDDIDFPEELSVSLSRTVE